MHDGLLDRRVNLIPPGDPDAIALWVALRAVEAVEAATDRMVAALESSGPVLHRVREVHQSRAILRSELGAEPALLGHVDAAIGTLLLHFVDSLRQNIVGSSRTVDEQLDLLALLRRSAGTLTPWDASWQEKASKLIDDARTHLAVRDASTAG